MFVYNLIIYLGIRDRAYLYYVFWIGSIAAISLLISGLPRLYGNDLFPSAPEIISAGTAFAWSITSISGVAFLREFLQTRQQFPRLHVITTFMLLAGWALFLLDFVLSTRMGVLLNIAYAAIYSAVGLAFVSVLAIRESRAARLYLLAWGPLLAALVYLSLSAFGGFRIIIHFTIASQIAICMGVTILSLALADRLNEERRERTRLSRLKQYLPQRVAQLVIEGDGGSLLDPKRRQVTVCVIDLRGFTPFSETSAPEDVMSVLRDFFTTMGDIVEKHGGTVEHFAGDSMLIFFNAPLEIPNPERQAIETAIEMRAAFEKLQPKWKSLGHELGLGIGIASGYATIGAIGFLGRSQYAAIGAVTNLASRLCSMAKHGEILVTSRVLAEIEQGIESESIGEQTIKGFSRPVEVCKLVGLGAAVA